jgi:F-type H+-transporting ATPase subunit epsilon
MSTTFTLTISDVSGALFSAQAASVSVPGMMGEMQLLAHHAPLISPLKAGTITVVLDDGSQEAFSIESGTLEVSNNQVTIIT